MKKRTLSEYPLTIEIINHFIVVRCKEFNISVSAGQFHLNSLMQEMPDPKQIGIAVYKAYILIHERLAQDINETSFRPKKNQTLSITQAAKILNISISTLRRLIDKGMIQCEKTEGKHRKPFIESVYQYKGNK